CLAISVRTVSEAPQPRSDQLRGDVKNRGSDGFDAAHSPAEKGVLQVFGSLYVYEKFGSSGRIRTYNPSVKQPSRSQPPRATNKRLGLCEISSGEGLGELWGYGGVAGGPILKELLMVSTGTLQHLRHFEIQLRQYPAQRSEIHRSG